MRSAIYSWEVLGRNRTTLTYLAQHHLDPAVMIATIEDLIVEKVIAPKLGRTIESAILDKTTREGRWK
jgi:hypothetical protein